MTKPTVKKRKKKKKNQKIKKKLMVHTLTPVDFTVSYYNTSGPAGVTRCIALLDLHQ